MNMMKLCDLHTHILPGMDDGAPTMEYALEMLRNAQASDVTLLAVTPHCNTPYGNGWTDLRQLQDHFLRLQQAAAQIPVKLVLGAEVRVTDDLPQKLKAGQIPSINNSRYLLTEFAGNTHSGKFYTALQEILDCGYVPLIAHPERYPEVCRHPEMVLDWLDMGCHLQLTGQSVMGIYGKQVKKTATFLLRNDLVACIASDAHGLNGRSNFLLDVYDHLSVHYSKAYANYLMEINPTRICNNQAL